MKNQYMLVLKAEGTRGQVRQATYDGEECLDARDLSTRWPVQVRARDISPYRHTLFLEGKAYRILNVVRSTR